MAPMNTNNTITADYLTGSSKTLFKCLMSFVITICVTHNLINKEDAL